MGFLDVIRIVIGLKKREQTTTLQKGLLAEWVLLRTIFLIRITTLPANDVCLVQFPIRKSSSYLEIEIDDCL